MRVIAAVRGALEAWFEEERDRAVLWLPVFMGSGVAFYYMLRTEPSAWVCAAALPALALGWWRPNWFAPVAAIVLGFCASQFATARAPPMLWQLPTKAAIVTGAISAVEMLPEGRRITIRPATIEGDAAALPRAVRVRLRPTDDGELQAGDRIRIRALIRPPSAPAYPDGWDLQRTAYYAGLGASGYALGPTEVVAHAMPSGQMRMIQWLREVIARRVSAVVPGAAGAVCVTLLTGASMAIPEVDHAAFRDSGLAHLLAVAGLHIGIVMGFALMLARCALRFSEHASLHWPTKKLAGAAALGAGGCYMVLTGMHVPIIRSFSMACLFTIALLADRRPFSMRGLGLAAVVLMLLAPQEVPEVSFQMSFSAVLALIAGYEALRPWLRKLHGDSWHRRTASHVVALALTSLLAGSASAPFGAYHFGQVQVYFVLANMVAVPLTAVWVMPAGLIGLGLMPLHLEALAWVPMGWGAEIVIRIARLCASLPAATFRVPHMPLWGLLVFSVGLAWLGIWRTRWRLLGAGPMAVGLASVFFAHLPDVLVAGDGRLLAVRTGRADYVQVSQGGSKFVRDAWASYLGITEFRAMPDTSAPDDDPAFRCGDGSCVVQPYADRKGVLLPRGAQHPDGCKDVSVIVSGEPARGLCAKPWPQLVDRFTVWRGGSAAIWLEPGGARIVLDRVERGTRPWTPPPPVSRKAAPSGLPVAAVDVASGK
jgi:competence protein ComEC